MSRLRCYHNVGAAAVSILVVCQPNAKKGHYYKGRRYVFNFFPNTGCQYHDRCGYMGAVAVTRDLDVAVEFIKKYLRTDERELLIVALLCCEFRP